MISADNEARGFANTEVNEEQRSDFPHWTSWALASRHGLPGRSAEVQAEES